MPKHDVIALKVAHPLKERCATLGIKLDGSGTAPCPKGCSSARRAFYVTNQDRWACRHCHPEHGDVVALEMWLRNIPFAEACEKLVAGVDGSLRPRPPQPEHAAQSWEIVPPAAWVEENERAMHKMRRALLYDEGCDCSSHRAYLASRGISPETAAAYGVGGYHSLPLGGVNVIQGAKCLSFPHTREGGTLTAVKYRLIAPLVTSSGARRFAMEPGSKPSLMRDPFFWAAEAVTLVAVEGEFNALSIAEARHHAAPIEVVSFGGEGSFRHLQSEIQGYKQVLLWLDESSKCVRALERLAHPRIMGVSSPGGLDANDILVQHGAEFLRAFVDAKIASICP